jgi:hypothetical protein
MRAQFGNRYIERYWRIDDELLLEAKGTKKHTQHRHRYLRLFEDEFDVADLGFLDPQQWSAWHSVLDETKQLDLVREDLRLCNTEKDQFAGLRRCVVQRGQEKGPHC